MNMKSYLRSKINNKAILGAVAGAIVPYVKKNAIDFLVSQSTTTLSVGRESPYYYHLRDYVINHVIVKQLSRSYRTQAIQKVVSRSIVGRDEEIPETTNSSPSNMDRIIDYGTHFGVFKNHPVMVKYYEEGKAEERRIEHIKIIFLGRSGNIADELLRLAGENIPGEVADESLWITKNLGDRWGTHRRINARPGWTVITRDVSIEDKIVSHVTNFTRREKWNIERGLPHHTGIILYGIPGTGKTSLIHVVASNMNRKFIHNLNLASITTDNQLAELLDRDINWSQSLLVIEDIDAFGLDLSRSDGVDRSSLSEHISISSLLNHLDGLNSPTGLVVIATTNYLESLDPALIRPGRFDLVLEVKSLGRAEFDRMAAL
jgi:chaperone BCS1